MAAVRAICGVGPADKLFSAYLSARDDYEAASVFGRLAPNLLRAMRPMGSSALQPFALVLSTLAVDVHPEVRKLVSPAAVELLGTTEDEYGYRLFTQLVNDCDPDVRLSVLLACADGRVEVDYRALVQERLAQDANFHLRHHAERQRLKCGIKCDNQPN